MLPQANRIREKRGFTKVLEAGKVIQTPLFGLAYLGEGNEPPRFGFIISNKISKRAYQRNRARRLLRGAARNLMTKLKNGFLFVLLAKHKLLDASSEEVVEQLKRALRDAKAMKI